MNYRIGLDLGIESVGWAVIRHDKDDEPAGILDMGVRMFDAAEVAKTGESLNKDRRAARGLRRLVRRRHQRMASMRNLIFVSLSKGGNKDNFFEELFGKKKNSADSETPVEIRVRALSEKLSDNELAVALYHIARHRGFKSNRRDNAKEVEEKKDKDKAKEEAGKIMKAIKENEKIMKEQGYQTVAQFLLSEYIKKEKPSRNKGGEYTHCILRSWLEDEVKIIFDKQRKFGNTKATIEFEKEFLELFSKQRNFDEGPNYKKGDPNSGKFSGGYKIGNCTFEKDQFRAPKNSFSAEYFKLLQDINNLNIRYADYSEKFVREIAEDINELIEWCLSKEKVTFTDLRKRLALPADARFNTGRVQYFPKKKKKGDEAAQKTKEQIVAEAEKEAVFYSNKGTYSIKKALGGEYNPRANEADRELFNEIARVIINAKSEEKRTKDFEANKIIKNAKLAENQIKGLLDINFDKVIHLSVVALNKIIPEMEAGLRYDEAAAKAYGSHSQQAGGDKKVKISWEEIYPDIEYTITSPVVKRTISQTIKVVNAIIAKFGSPSAIFIEMTREMRKNHDERKVIKQNQDERASENQKLFERLKTEFGESMQPKGGDIVKLRLYEEQGGKCAYCGVGFESKFGKVPDIFSNNNTQIDHIVPYSKCFDDSYNNKVICCSDCNSNKGNRLPYEAFGSDTNKWAQFEAFVNSRDKWSEKKKKNCFRKQITQEELKEMGGRALNDTSTIANTVADIFRRHLHFEQSSLIKKPVRTVNGTITAYLRKIWGLKKDRNESDKHHSQDAAVVACATNGMIQNLTRYFQDKEKYRYRNSVGYIDLDTGEVMTEDEHLRQFAGIEKEPYEDFKYDVEKHLKDVFVSRMPNRKVKGQIHQETVRSSPGEDERGMTIVEQRVDITKLKLATDNDKKLLKDKNGNCYIVGYSERAKFSDPLTYKVLLARLVEFYDPDDNDYVKKAFKDPIYKTIDGKFAANANQIKKVKIQDVRSGGFHLEKLDGEKTKAIADNGGMIRIDVFRIKVESKKPDPEATPRYKYYWIPVYVADYYNSKRDPKVRLPNKVVPFKSCLTIDETEVGSGEYILKDRSKETETPCEFCFSLYKNDLVHIKRKIPMPATNEKTKVKLENGVNDIFVYYNCSNISSGAIDFNADDRRFVSTTGIQEGMEIFEKYEVDIMGNISKNPVKEKRLELNLIRLPSKKDRVKDTERK